MTTDPFSAAHPEIEDAESRLRFLAAKYETPQFVASDPVRFVHEASGDANKETTGLVAACLSYGNRSQFMAKIASVVAEAGGDLHNWIKEGKFEETFFIGDETSFYRIFPRGKMAAFFARTKEILLEYGTIGTFVRMNTKDGVGAVEAICEAYSDSGCSPVVPQDTSSVCNRLCMFMRWMVRIGSPVDVGLWSSWIDKRTLVVPLDVHVARQARKMGLLYSRAPTMQAALGLTLRLAEVFPDDPLKGDFALFGLGVND
ncbi:MAG: TIGR02757 family protein [Kiritimatiellae bacterium]|nr:TIGR02757 family protein [Kiritimatiellia bacterium]